MEAKILDLIDVLCNAHEAKDQAIMRGLGLSAAEYQGLLSFRSREKIPCRELAERMRLSLSRCSRVIDRLFGRGFIQRADCSSDRRCKHIWLTADGRAVRRRIDAERELVESLLEAGYSSLEAERVKTVLQALITKLET